MEDEAYSEYPLEEVYERYPVLKEAVLGRYAEKIRGATYAEDLLDMMVCNILEANPTTGIDGMDLRMFFDDGDEFDGREGLSNIERLPDSLKVIFNRICRLHPKMEVRKVVVHFTMCQKPSVNATYVSSLLNKFIDQHLPMEADLVWGFAPGPHLNDCAMITMLVSFIRK